MKSSILVLAVFYSTASGSQAADLSDQQRIHQQARQQALEAQLAPSPEEVHLSVLEKTSPAAFPTEAHGFPLARVTLTGSRHSVLGRINSNNPAARVAYFRPRRSPNNGVFQGNTHPMNCTPNVRQSSGI